MGVALISLFIALTGTSIAAVAAFPPNSVGARELKNGSVGTKELKGRSVTFGKIAAGAITSGLVRNGSLTMSDFNQHQLPSGPIGAVGPAGPMYSGAAGPPGPQGVPGLRGEKGEAGGLLGSIRMPTESIVVQDAPGSGTTSADVGQMCARGERALSAGTVVRRRGGGRALHGRAAADPGSARRDHGLPGQRRQRHRQPEDVHAVRLLLPPLEKDHGKGARRNRG